MIFPNIDLNLLKLFVSLYTTGSVTTTANELSLSQSACSHALQRLRERLGDKLFIRIDNKMIPTELSIKLAENLLPGLALINKGLQSSSSFNPNELHTFKISATDYTAWCMQPFIAHLSKNFSGISVEFISLDEQLPESALKKAEIDLVCGYSHQKSSSESLGYIEWFEDKYVCTSVIDDLSKSNITLEQFLSHQHVLVTPWNEKRGIIDIALAKIKKKRRISIKTTSVIAAPYFLRNTPYLLTLPNKYANIIKEYSSLNIYPMPFEVPNYTLLLYWHKTRQADPKIKWFIQQFAKLNGLENKSN
ncbi:LysR family transcriptional regulator [Colwelliaceae bacterium MEBiC 14330]